MQPPRNVTCMVVIIAATLGLFAPEEQAFGQPDPSFHPPFFAVPSTPGRAQLLPDDRYLLFFNIDTLTDQPTGSIITFFPDATLDTSFNFSRRYAGGTTVPVPTPGGQLITSASQTVYGFFDGTETIRRLNADGSIDASFNSAAKASDNVRAIAFQPDGTILVVGFFTQFAGQNRPGIVRLLADGSLDMSFAPVSLQFSNDGSANLGIWARPAVQSDGKILIGGDFSGVNNVSCLGIARLNSDGTLDMTFNASAGYTRNNGAPIRGIVVQSDGKIVIGGRLLINGTGVVPLARLNSDGTLDSSFVYAPGFFSGGGYPGGGGRVRDLIQQPDGKLLPATKRIVRFNADGSIDNSFHEPLLLVYRDNTATFPEAYTVNLQSDGHILIGGTFTDIDDAPPNPPGPTLFGVARLNSDGTVDNTLTTIYKTGYDVSPSSFARQPDGRTLIAFVDRGLTRAFGDPAIPHNYGRLHSDGTLDMSFDPLGSLSQPYTALGFCTLPDGNIFAFGTRDQDGQFGYQIFTPNGMVVDPNYQHDPTVSFDKAYPQPSQTPGQVIVLSSGSASTELQQNAQNVVNNTELRRLNSNGSLDASFVLDASVLASTVQRDLNGNIQAIAVASSVLALSGDGKILFAYLATDSTYRLVRLNPNGSLDSTFQAGSVPAAPPPGPSYVSFVTVLDPHTNTQVTVPVLSFNGVLGLSGAQLVGGNQIILVGQFASYANMPAHGIVRLNGNGTVDGTFQAGSGAQWTQTVETSTFHPSIDNIKQADNGKLLVTGTFEAFNGVAFPGIALLNPNGSLDPSFVPPAVRQKFDGHTAYLAKQPDNSFLLSGPYSLPNQTQSPSFITIFGAPIVITNAATNPTAFSATLNGTVNPNGLSTSVHFEYGTTTSYGSSTSSQNFSGNTTQPVSADISGLSPNTTYHFRLVGMNSGGSSLGNDRTFTTSGGIPPIVTTNAATNVTSSSATLKGTVNPNGQTTTVLFEYGTTTSYGTSTSSQTFNGNSTQSVNVNISGLSPNTTYHARLLGMNSGGTSFGYDVTFRFDTNAEGPVIVTSPATNVMSSSATLNGTVNPGGLTTIVYFQYGASASYGFTTATQSGYIGNTTQPVSVGIPGLGPSTTYHFRLVGTNSGGTSFGIDRTFTTPAAGAAPGINSPASATTTVGQLFSYQITATNGPSSYTAAPLPQGMSFDGVRGILSGTPTNAGTTPIHLTASNSHGMGAATLTLSVHPVPNSGLTIANGTSITARTHQFFSFEVFTTGGSANARLTATHLPPGLSADPVTGLISGTPSVDGSFGVILTVTDGSVTTTSTLQLTFTSNPAVPVISSPREVTLVPGQYFSYRIVDSSQQSGTTFSVTGQLPPGLTLNPVTGVISGVYNPHDQNGGGLIFGGQTNSHHGSGNATNTFHIFQQRPCTLLKIATRGVVQSGNSQLSGTVNVAGNAPEKVMVRAIGPSLRVNGVPLPGRLQNPTLELHHGFSLIAHNDDWHTTQLGGIITSNQVTEIQNCHLGNVSLVPTNPLESSIIANTLAPGNYNAIVRAKPGTTGTVGSVEFYDLGTGLNYTHFAQLANFSTRSLVQTGNNVMRTDFTLGSHAGTGSHVTVLLRALGPSLPVQGHLQNPTLELRNAAYSLIAFNDNWTSAPNHQAISNSGHAPSNPHESAILVTLPQGNYTAVVRGYGNTTGIAQVEGYVLPP